MKAFLHNPLQDFEIPLVDDSSPENNGKRCDEVTAKDSRIHIVHHGEGGVGSFGFLDWFASSWISFVDSDDTILFDLHHIHDTVVKSCGDLTACRKKLY